MHDARAVQWYLRLHGRAPRVQAGAYEIPAHASPAADSRALRERQGGSRAAHGGRGGDVRRLPRRARAAPARGAYAQGQDRRADHGALGHPGVGGGRGVLSRHLPLRRRHAPTSRSWSWPTSACSARWPRPGRSAAPDLPFDDPVPGADPRLDRGEGGGAQERARADRRGVRQPPAQGHATAVRSDRDLRARRELRRQHPHARSHAPTRPTTPTRARGCRRRRSRCRDASRCWRACIRRQTDALYFVATGLGDGAHHFSATLEEHNAAVQTYLARLRRAQRAANPPVAPGAAAGQGRRPP